MARKKPYLAVLADGSLIPTSDRDLFTVSNSPIRQAIYPHSYLRVGRYGIAIGSRDIAVMLAYSDEDTEELFAQRGVYDPGRFRKETQADKRAQLAHVRRYFRMVCPLHPMRGLVEHDIDLQLLAFKE